MGYSQGTIQMHYGLARLESSFHADNVYKVVNMAPCFIIGAPNWTKFYANRTVMRFQELGIYAINGPNWDRDLQTICDNFPGPICLSYTNGSGSQPRSAKDEQHWLQNGLTNNFQDWVEIDDWLAGSTQGTIVDVSQIKTVPMTFFIGENDHVCPKR